MYCRKIKIECVKMEKVVAQKYPQSAHTFPKNVYEMERVDFFPTSGSSLIRNVYTHSIFNLFTFYLNLFFSIVAKEECEFFVCQQNRGELERLI